MPYFYGCRGKDFRPCFNKIGGLRVLNSAPYMALTASAPPAIKADVL